MADKKISELTALTGANVADTDLLPIVDTSATETKKITFGEFKTALDTATGFVRITGDTMTGDLSFGDNNKAIFGDGSDLQIYHDGSHSYIKDAGDGQLRLLAGTNVQIWNSDATNLAANFNGDTQTAIYYAGEAKLTTTSTGIDVTGDITLGDTNPTITFNDSSIVSLSHTVSSASDNLRLAVDVNGVDVGSRVEIFDGSTEVARFSSGAVLVTGTVTAEGLTVENSSLDVVFKDTQTHTTTDGPALQFQGKGPNGTNYNFGYVQGLSNGVNNAGDIVIGTNTAGVSYQRLRIEDNGDISFYEDTGETPKFFWDASLEALGVGITPSTAMHVYSASGNTALRVETGLTNGQAQINFKNDARRYNVGINSSDNLVFEDDTAGLTRMTIDSSGNVGIGTSSPSTILDVSGTSATLTLRDSRVSASWTAGTALGKLDFYTSDATGIGPHSVASIGVVAGGDNAASPDGELVFATGPYNTASSERMRIDSSGNVGIGTSSPSTKLDIDYSHTNTTISSPLNTALRLQNTNAGADNYLTALSFTTSTTGVGSDSVIASVSESAGNSALTFWTDTSNGMSEKVRIDSSGNVGIGRTPSVVESTYDSLQLGAGGTWLSGSSNLAAGNFGQNYYIDASGDNLYLGNDEAERIVLNNGYIAFETAPTNASGAGAALTWSESMRIDASGNVLVGVTGTGELGVTNQGVLLRDGFIQVAQTGTTSATLVYFYNGNGQVGGISTSGSTTTYATSSDYRLKTDAQPMVGASARVQALKPVNFEWISSGERVDGFLAHEAQEVVPECVTGTKDAMRDEEYEVTAAVLDADGTVVTEAVMGTRSVPDMQGIDQSKLVPLLTAALQEALTKIADMEIRLSALEG
jgi:hypothetical protein